MAYGLRWKPILKANQRGLAEKVLMFENMVAGGVAIFQLAIYLIPLIDIFTTANPLSLAHMLYHYSSHSLAFSTLG